MIKKLAAAILFGSIFCSCGSSADSFSFAAPSGLNVPPAVRQVMTKPLYQEGAVWGLRVVDAQTGEVLLDQGADYPFYIGSIRKVFDVSLLLEAVGADHTYDTPVFRMGTVDTGGVLNGNLVLVASGDLTMGGRRNPDGTLAISGFDHNEANSLGNAELTAPDPLAGYKSLAQQVAQSGITRVTGDVVVDDRLFQPFNFRGEFNVTPIFVNDNVVDLSLTPGPPGQAADVSVRPTSSALAIVNNLLSGSAGSELDIDIEPELPDDIGTPGASSEISGTLPIDLEPPFTNRFPLIRTVRITKPNNYARTVFVEALEAAGVTVDADTVKENPSGLLETPAVYPADRRVALLVGTPFGEVAKYILKVSYNLGADVTLMMFGLTKGVNTQAQALAAERDVLVDALGLSADGFHFVDGSGGGETTATNTTVTSLLLQVLESDNADVILEALPSLGEDGSLGFVTDYQADPTLAPATGQVKAKTGTYAEGSASGILVKGQGCGGVIDTRNGRRLVYQLVVNNVKVSSINELTQIFQDQGTISAILWRDF